LSQKEFETAQLEVKNLKKRPSNEELLDLYSLYKQASSGDVQGKRPGAFSLKERAKWDAWQDKKGLDKDQAMQNYIGLVTSLKSKYGA